MIKVTYKEKPFELEADLVSNNEQTMQFVVYGKQKLLIECDYPIAWKEGIRGEVKWQVLEGQFSKMGDEEAHLVMQIFRELEKAIGKQYPR